MRDITSGAWFEVKDKSEFNLLKKYGHLNNKYQHCQARVQIGDYDKPGNYYVLKYIQPRFGGTCGIDVIEVLSAIEAVEEFEDTIDSLNWELEEARTKLPG